MAGDEVSVLRLCSVCHSPLGKLTFKKENMMLAAPKAPVWCDACKANRREIREVEGRKQAILQEHRTYPHSSLDIDLEDVAILPTAN